ncbi:unnamed protein product [Rotaria magnacalcarata]
MLRDVCDDLVNKQLLLKVDRGTGYSTKAVTIYIKALPNQNSIFEYQQFMMALASLGNSCVTMSSILESCKTIKYVPKKRPVEKIFEILNQPQYKIINLDLTPLYLEHNATSVMSSMNKTKNDFHDDGANHSLSNYNSNEFGTQDHFKIRDSICKNKNNYICIDEQVLIISDEMTVAANEVIDESVCDNEEFIEDQDIQTRSSSNFGIPTVSSIQYEHQTRLPRATF